jgi:hypothetical protein
MRTSRGASTTRRWLERRLFTYCVRLRLALNARGPVSQEREFAARWVWRGPRCDRPRGAGGRGRRTALVSAEPAGDSFTVFRLTKRAPGAGSAVGNL